jgi:TRAP transporter TAXI family solute receptor
MILVIDVGTSSIRAAAVDPDGSVRHLEQRSFPPHSPAPGLVEFDPAALGAAVLDMAGAGESALASRGGSYEFGTFDMVKSRFAGGTADVFVQVATLGHPSITEIAQNTPVTFLEPSKAVLDSMAKQYGWELRILPAGTFPGQTKDIPLPGSTTVLFASTALSDEMAYKITKTVCEQTAKLRASHKALSNFDCSDGKWKREVTGLPLHPGAERYFREKGWLK